LAVAWGLIGTITWLFHVKQNMGITPRSRAMACLCG
jgi:hypothetical protein